MARATQSALVVDDEPEVLKLLEMMFEKLGIDADTAASVAEARRLLSHHHYDLCITDMKMPNEDGLVLIKYLHRKSPETPVAVLTGYGNEDPDSTRASFEAGAFEYLTKPIRLTRLKQLVEQSQHHLH